MTSEKAVGESRHPRIDPIFRFEKTVVASTDGMKCNERRRREEKCVSDNRHGCATVEETFDIWRR